MVSKLIVVFCYFVFLLDESHLCVMCIYIYIYIHTYVYIYIYIYTYIHIHTYFTFTSTLVGADDGPRREREGGRRRKEREVRGRPLTQAARRTGARRRKKKHEQTNKMCRQALRGRAPGRAARARTRRSRRS